MLFVRVLCAVVVLGMMVKVVVVMFVVVCVGVVVLAW